MAGAAVASGTTRIAEAFPEASELLIKLIISFPPLFMIFSALITGIVGQRIKSRTLIVCGLLLFLIGGVGAGQMNSIVWLLFFRAILGLGTGMILPFSTGLIAALYDGEEKTKMMGYSFSANNLGAMLANISAGILASVSWRHTFDVYWMGLLVLVLVLLFLKDLPYDRREDAEKSTREAQKTTAERIPRRTFLIGACAMAVMMVFYLIVTNLTLMVEDRGLGSSVEAGYLFAANTLVMLLGGIGVTHALRLKRFFIPIVLLFLAAGLFGISTADSLPLMAFSVILSGMGLGLLFPYLLNLASEGVSETQSIKVMSITMAFAWFGQFLSPLFYDALSSVTGLDAPHLFLLTSFLCVTSAICSVIWSFRKTKTTTVS